MPRTNGFPYLARSVVDAHNAEQCNGHRTFGETTTSSRSTVASGCHLYEYQVTVQRAAVDLHRCFSLTRECSAWCVKCVGGF